MRNFEGLKPNSQLRLVIIGINRTTTGVLLIKAEDMATMSKIISIARLTFPLE